MQSFAVLSIAVALAGTASAQYNIDPSSVPLPIRQTWCTNQQTQCPLLCLQMPGNSATTRSNTCVAATLDYTCVCENGQSIDSAEFSQTIPFYKCQEFGNQCVSNCNGDNTCASSCRQNNICGATDPQLASTSTLAASPTAARTSTGTDATNSAATPSKTANFDTFGEQQPTGRTNNNGGGSGAAGLVLSQSYGVAMVATGLLAGFGLLF